jgi:hypothetical protein
MKLRTALAATLIAALAAPSIMFAQEGPPPLPFKLLVLASPKDPEVFRGDSTTHVAYELLLANFTPETIKLDSLDYGAGSRPVNGDQLKSMFTAIGANAMKPQAPVLKPSEAAVIFVFLNNWEASKWTDKLTVEAEGKPQTRQNFAVDQIASTTKPIIISAPLRGGNWWTPNGPSNDSIHRRVIVAMGDHLGLPERFAVDWVQLDADGKTYTGPESENRSYHCYGAEVLAAADGRVVSTKDGIPENVPGSPKMAVPRCRSRWTRLVATTWSKTWARADTHSMPI